MPRGVLALTLLGILLLFLTPSIVPAISFQRVALGEFQSRAFWIPADRGPSPRPTVILVPGSGPNGPEEMVPPMDTLDGQFHPLLLEMGIALHHGGVNVLAVGKPGVEFFSGNTIQFYDQALYQSLQWQDQLANVLAGVNFSLERPETDPRRVYILGHSEGSNVAIDLAQVESRIRGILLVSASNNLDQLFGRGNTLKLRAVSLRT